MKWFYLTIAVSLFGLICFFINVDRWGPSISDLGELTGIKIPNGAKKITFTRLAKFDVSFIVEIGIGKGEANKFCKENGFSIDLLRGGEMIKFFQSQKFQVENAVCYKEFSERNINWSALVADGRFFLYYSEF